MQVKSPCLETRGSVSMGVRSSCDERGGWVKEQDRYRKERDEGVRTGIFSKPDLKKKKMFFLRGVCECSGGWVW